MSAQWWKCGECGQGNAINLTICKSCGKPRMEAHHRDIIKDVTGKEFGPPKRDLMNKTENEFSRILEARRQHREIVSWKFQGIALYWGKDPKTGRMMRYRPDFVIFRNILYSIEHPVPCQGVLIIEVKGAHIWSRDKVRFRGCRAEWPQFAFEMHQKTKDGWNRIE